jgi:hypothetical protein
MKNILRIVLIVVIIIFILFRTILNTKEGFDCGGYYSRYEDLQKAFGYNCESLLNHWTRHGQYEGRDSGPLPRPKASYKNMGNYDYWGNDLLSVSHLTPNKCIDICDMYSKCVGVVTNQKDLDKVGTCWFKSAMNESQASYPNNPRYAYSIMRKRNDPWWMEPPDTVGDIRDLIPPKYTQSQYMDHPGSDITHLNDSSYLNCETKCDSLPDCKGFNFSKSLYPNGNGTCWIKNNVSNKRATPDLHLFSKNVDMVIPPPTPPPGKYTQTQYTDQISSDITHLNNSSYSDCEKKCDSLPECKGFNFQSHVYPNGNGQCWIKNNVNNTVSTNGWHLFSKN